ncbi:MAG: signal peptidase II [Erysipelotrichaceae bacterium]|nr:signal peptidase II [Erysipelotrichaceae bacterium]
MKDEVTKAKGTSEEETKFRWNGKTFFFSFLWLAVLLLVVDLASKWGVVNYFHTHPIHENPHLSSAFSKEVIPDFFYLTLSFNKGSSFGFGDNVVWARYVFIVISWVASGALAWYWWKNLPKNDRWMNAVLALAFSGALGNAIDRTFYWDNIVGFSGVVDFFQFYLFGADKDSFAIFNVADSALVVAVAILIVLTIVRAIKDAAKKD